MPMAGLVLSLVNIHLNKSTIAFLLSISSSLAIMVDQEFFHLAEEALRIWSEKNRDNNKSFRHPLLIVIADGQNHNPEEVRCAWREE
ncbi:hypothetical protein K1719_003646 [Acacia pycnantha]|nr:hypothetical protein K1719_003646 [Acacia pycnantha]